MDFVGPLAEAPAGVVIHVAIAGAVFVETDVGPSVVAFAGSAGLVAPVDVPWLSGQAVAGVIHGGCQHRTWAAG